jgi:hypothetical protein
LEVKYDGRRVYIEDGPLDHFDGRSLRSDHLSYLDCVARCHGPIAGLWSTSTAHARVAPERPR